MLGIKKWLLNLGNLAQTTKKNKFIILISWKEIQRDIT